MARNFPQSITADGIKGHGQVYENCIKTHVPFSAFLLCLPQHEDHVRGPSVSFEHTLAFWRVLIIIVIIIMIIIMVIFKSLSLKALSALQNHEGGGGTG